NRPIHERQHLPLRHLRPNHVGHRTRGQDDERRWQMSERPFDDFLSEPERYELDEGSPFWDLSRREFSQILGGGIIVAILFKDVALAQGPPQRRQRGGGTPPPQDIGAWLHIGEDSAVTAYTGKVEIRQNIRTSLTQVVAEELRMPTERIRLVMADTQFV